MKFIAVFVFLIAFSLYGQSQTRIEPQDHSSKLTIKSFNDKNKYAHISFTTGFSLRNTSTAYDLQNDSLFIRSVYLNQMMSSGINRRMIYNGHYYYGNDPVQPYGTYESTLFVGTLNYLFMLFDNRK